MLQRIPSKKTWYKEQDSLQRDKVGVVGLVKQAVDLDRGDWSSCPVETRCSCSLIDCGDESPQAHGLD